MPYATLSDLNARFGEQEITQVSDRTGEGMADAKVIETAILDASVEMDAYLGNCAVLPLATPYPALLVRLCCDLARYFLYKDKAPEAVRLAREDAISLLRRIASGEAAFPGAAAQDTVVVSGIAVSSSKRVFTDALLSQMAML